MKHSSHIIIHISIILLLLTIDSCLLNHFSRNRPYQIVNVGRSINLLGYRHCNTTRFEKNIFIRQHVITFESANRLRYSYMAICLLCRKVWNYREYTKYNLAH